MADNATNLISTATASPALSPNAPNTAGVVNIAGTDYDPGDLTDQQKYWIAQVQDLQGKRRSAQFQLDQITVAADSFMNALIQSLSDETDEPKEKLNG